MSGRETRGQPGEGASEAAADPPSQTPSSERTPATGAFEFALATAPLPNASELAPGVVSSVLKQGDRIGEQERFEITGQLGRGGIGRVFSALDRQLDRSVAVKFINPDPRIPWEDLV